MGDERLTKSDFCELIPHLSIEDLLLIEYRITDWKKMITLLNISQKLYRCNICMVKQLGDKIRLHMDDTNHKIKIKAVKQFYLEGYTYPKNHNIKEVKVMVTNIRPENNVKNLKVKNPVNVINKTSTNEKTNLKKVSVQTIANKGKTAEESTKGQIESVKADARVAAPKAVKTNAGNAIGKSKVATGNTKEICNKPLEVNKKNSLKGNNNTQTLNNKQLATANKQGNNLLKNPFAHKENTSSTDDAHVTIVEDPPEVIVIDDDKLSDVENEVEKSLGADKKNEIQKTNFETNEGKDSSSKSQIVVNPAALLIEKSTEQIKKQNESKSSNSNDKPNYQKNIVVIPTVCKNQQQKKSDPNQNKDTLNFVTKSFTTQPNKRDILGLIGVEYVVKILKHKTDNSPRYECSLCEIRLFGNDMQNHLAGYNHRLKYTEKHYPTALRHFRRYITTVPEHEVFKVLAPILHKLAYAIEEHHGRNLPYECFEWEYNSERSEILTKVYSLRHASELTGPSFTQVVDTKEIDQLIAERHNYKPPALLLPPEKKFTDVIRPSRTSGNLTTTATLIPAPALANPIALPTNSQYNYQYNNYRNFPQTDFNYRNFQQKPMHNYNYNAAPPVQQVDDSAYNQLVEDFLRDTNRGRRQNLKRSRTRSPLYESKRLKYGDAYERERRKSISPLRKDDIWQAYRHMVDRKLDEINMLYKGYTNDPETHPMYNQEWQKFWRRRKDELLTAGLDHRSYNYQPEWIAYFKTRITELYNQCIEEAKVECRERLCLPMANHTLDNPNYHVKNVSQDSIQSTSSNKPKPQNNNMTDLKTKDRYENAYKCKVVPVLRLMTALEEQLGSLGPKIIELMSKTLQIEKTNPKEVDRIILSNENCTMLQTCMEKFKGLVISGLLEGTKANALNKAIKEIEMLLDYAEQEFKNNGNELLESFKHAEVNKRATTQVNIPVPVPMPVPAPVTRMRNTNDSNINNNVQINTKSSYLPDTNESAINQRKSSQELRSPNPQILAVLEQYDIKDLATKFAASLTAQGKTNFTLDQLEKLLSVYKVMEKKKLEQTSFTNSTTNSGSSAAQKNTENTSLSDTLTKFIIPLSSSQRDNISDGQSHSNRTETVTTNFSNNNINNRFERRSNIPTINSGQNNNYSSFSNSSNLSNPSYSSSVSQNIQQNIVRTNNNNRNNNNPNNNNHNNNNHNNNNHNNNNHNNNNHNNVRNTMNSNLSVSRNMNMNTSQNYADNMNTNNSNMWNTSQNSNRTGNFNNFNNNAGSNNWSTGRTNWNGNNSGNNNFNQQQNLNTGSSGNNNFNQQQNLNTGFAQHQTQQRSTMPYQQLNQSQSNQSNRPNKPFQSFSASLNQNQGQNRNNNWLSSTSTSTPLSNRSAGRVPQIWETSNQSTVNPQITGQSWTRF